ncbi:acetyl/propionyl/methylcrotonyl-CoA carboxylase subunit alpha [Magnetospirillum molischianum]|uniref:Putative acyl-CoA carboxylase biotin-carrying subunit alpha chain n=1 Tax=Magnetospirillum molischianum DSM 120 TaxID=1150626 RepID=H8FS91_MAGML|nr:acetyl/propionyl/methylcrotonyl-CoA carboxylase subunit alpha [Magnetospirillum molischianum]CCG41229.1 putative acyl-CoA carboxylase biotin-carrying subunit; alpha chain [Magnetospirillum molischianum DSM 120]
MFSKILIANRGEIACRVIRTAQRMGIATVAVHSDADAGSAHVALADEAWAIGPAPSRESYLRADTLIDVARRSGAEAIHPGYGFLSENADFAEACAAAGLIFIGPPVAAIRAMGGKSEAKALMERAGVPLVPGYHGMDQDAAVLAAAADKIGYPVLIKASAGGGGKGMRVVETPDAFAADLAAAKREAAGSFGDDRVLIEKYLARPRHVEIQVFADGFDNAVSLFERDCSIQRRHQKVVEEAPAPGMAPDLRRRMGDAAIAAARAIGYRGAGTVEFLLEPDGSFYFMEMNTRLQVEHPVTEFITGLDLVEWQLRVAAGQALPLGQDDLAIRGHAIEVRLYAEDPDAGFMPATGRLDHLRFPVTGPHLRVDSGVRQGDRISVHYDPMIAKLIVWDEDRAGAVRRLRSALAATEVAGLTTNIAFLASIAAHPAFAEADLDTGFIERHRAQLLPSVRPVSDDVLALVCLGLLLERRAVAGREAAASSDPHSPWALCDGWRLNDDAHDNLHLRHGETDISVPLIYRPWGYELMLPGGPVEARGSLTADGRLSAEIGPVRRHAGYVRRGAELSLFLDGGAHRLVVVDPLPSDEPEEPETGVVAPMPGTVVAVLVEAGAKVVQGQPLVVMEAMKMEHTLKAPANGTVSDLHFAVGALVDEGDSLVAFEAEVA